jgi:hypothetical protein
VSYLPQPIEYRHDILEDLSDTERVPATRLGGRVVKMEDVDTIAARTRNRKSIGGCEGPLPRLWVRLPLRDSN